MADSLEKENLDVWFRRPSIFIANAWYLMAAAALYILPLLWTLIGYYAPALELLFSGLNSVVYNLLVLALPVAMHVSQHPGVSQSMRLKKARWYECLEAAALALHAVVLGDCLSSWWLLLLQAIGGQLTPAQAAVSGWQGLPLTLITSALLPAVCEELLLRGGVLGAWERRGTLYGLCVSSVLFCALHGSIQGLPVQLLMGFVLGVLVIRADSLLPGMICHAVFNAASLLLSAQGGADAAAYQNVAAWIAQHGGFTRLIVRTLASAFVFGALLMMYLAHRAKEPFEKVKPGEGEVMQWDELLLLLAGLLTVAMRYGADLLSICGLG